MAACSKSSSTPVNLPYIPPTSPLHLPYISPTSPLHLGGLLEELLNTLEGEVLAAEQRQHLAELVRVERALVRVTVRVRVRVRVRVSLTLTLTFYPNLPVDVEDREGRAQLRLRRG